MYSQLQKKFIAKLQKYITETKTVGSIIFLIQNVVLYQVNN